MTQARLVLQMMLEGSSYKAFEQKVFDAHRNHQSVGSINNSTQFAVEMVSALKFVTLLRICRYINRAYPAIGHDKVKPSRYAIHA
jgi:hypothetical protein